LITKVVGENRHTHRSAYVRKKKDIQYVFFIPILDSSLFLA
jgi:hypothetical protein